MVEAGQFQPGFNGVAPFAAFRTPVRSALCHLLFELPTVRIGVTTGARTIFEPVRDNLRRVSFLADRVAVRASYRQMGARKRETALLMLRDGESRRLESADGVASFALALVRRGRKLSFVHILVAIKTFRIGNFVLRRSAGRDVAFRAGHAGMFGQQRVCRVCVGLYIEERRLPSIHGVASGAFSLVAAARELTAVRIGRVAIRAFRKRHRLLEISVGVALNAINLRVFSQQRKLCL